MFILLIITARCTSALRGIAIECHPYVCPSVTLVDQSGPHSLEILKTNCPAISPTPSLFVAQRPSTYFQGNMGKFWGDYRGGVGKSGVLQHKSGSISETREDRGKVTVEGEGLYRKSPTLFRTVPPPTPYGLLFPKTGVRNPHPKLQSLLSQERVGQILRTSNLAGTFTGSIRTKAH